MDYHQQALAIDKQIGNKAGEGTTLNNIGGVYFNLGEYAKALDYLQQSLAIIKQVGNKTEEGTILSNIGAVYNTINKYPDAEKNLFAAINIWESLRGGLTDDQKVSIFETQASTYRYLQTVLIAQNKTIAALEVSERGRARALIELLSSKSNPNQQLNIKPPNIEQIKQIAQQQKATFVEYSFVNESVEDKKKQHPKLYIWVIKTHGRNNL